MNKDQAKKLLDETFNHEFDQQKFSKFLTELFNGFRIENRGLGVSKEYSEYISEFRKLGEYNDGKKSMEVLVVKLKKSNSLERARTMQRNFIAKWLSMGYEEKDGALVAFYGDDPYDWRFSFIKMDYRLVEKENGKIKTEKELTPAKRYSFLVGVNEPNHTCRSQFLDLVIEEKEKPSLQEIENAFSIEKVTKEFFLEYKELFSKLAESLEKVFKREDYVKKEFEEKNISVRDFSKKLLGQIVFIYFLQKKGWLGVEKDEAGRFKEWGTGPKNFLKRLFDKKIVDYTNFFNDILEPLFYEALAKERDDDYYSRFKCKIPFLNGGLFEPINSYDWTKTEILLDNSIFKDILETFDKYNFTIKEDEPLEKEVAVDPEMLGKVFESLLDVNDRKSKGAFYTPREIVHYMCQQSLINYLETNSKLPKKDIEFFIQKGEFALDQLRRAQIDGYAKREFILPESIRKEAQLLDDLLKNIKIVDPAVGSGAFPVGMMNEIVRARTILTHFFKDKSTRTDYNLKRETIENCLYGVDVESSAVEITKLRFWLSLIVDELDMKNIKPLPNLDNKIMCGNSLVEEFEGVKLYKDITESSGDKQVTLDSLFEKKRKESEKKLSRLRELQKEFFSEQNRKRKNELREEIDKIEWEFIEETLKEQGNEEAMEKLKQYKKNKSKPFFLWKLYFSDVFNKENPGFDISIGNPPYAQVPKGIVDVKDFPYSEGKDKGKQNLYKLFIEKAYNLIRENGTTILIVQSSLLCDLSSQFTRELLLTKTSIEGFIEFPKKADNSEGQVFDSVLQGTCIVSFRRKMPEKNQEFFISIDNDKNTISKLITEKLTQKSILDIYPEGFFIPLIKPKEFEIVHKIAKNPILKEFIKESKQGDLNLSTNKELIVDYDTGIKFYRGKHVHRYYFDENTKEYIDLDKTKDKKFKQHLSNLTNKNQEEGNLILMQQITGTTDRYRLHACFFAKDKSLFGHSVRVISLKDKKRTKLILALLNSKILDWYFRKTSTNNNVNGYEIEQLPIPNGNNDLIISKIDELLNKIKNENYLENPESISFVRAFEKKIDKLIYEFYRLTPEEIDIIEKS